MMFILPRLVYHKIIYTKPKIQFAYVLHKIKEVLLTFTYLRHYKKESILGPSFKMLEAGFELLVPLIIASLIDNGISTHNTTNIINNFILLVVFALIGLVCSLTAQYFSARAAVGLSSEMRRDLFVHIQHLSPQTVKQIGSSSLITRLTSDINQIQVGINLLLRLFLRSPFVVFGAAFMACTIDIHVALIFFIVIALLSIVVFTIMLVSAPLYKKVQTNLDNISNRIRENLIGVRVIRAFRREEHEVDVFKRSNHTLLSSQIFAGKISTAMNPLTFILVNMGIVTLLWTGALRVEIGTLTQGQVVALINYMSQILVELVKLANLIITVTKALACSKRIQDIMNTASSGTYICNDQSSSTFINTKKFDKHKICNIAPVRKKTNCIPVDISLKNVSFDFGGAEVLSNITFDIPAGTTLGIIGSTGSGKTVLGELIAHLYDATGGNITLNHQSIDMWDEYSLHQAISVVPQHAMLLTGTIAHNLSWRNENATQQEIYNAIAIAQAKEFVDKLPNGILTQIEQGAANLSGGQCQRLTIARALIGKPSVLILDDSTSALDYATEQKLRHDLYNLNWHPTVIIISQRISSIRHAQNIIVLDNGRVCGEGPHEHLLQTCNIYQEIYDSQSSTTFSSELS